jgi:hypothetical protein
MAWLNFGAKLCSVTYSNFCLCFPAPYKIPMFHTRVADRMIKPCKIQRARIGAVCEQWLQRATGSFRLLSLQAS